MEDHLCTELLNRGKNDCPAGVTLPVLSQGNGPARNMSRHKYSKIRIAVSELDYSSFCHQIYKSETINSKRELKRVPKDNILSVRRLKPLKRTSFSYLGEPQMNTQSLAYTPMEQ